MSPKDPNIVVLSSKPPWVQLAQTHLGQFWVAKKKTTQFQLDLQSQKKMLRHYSYDVGAGARRQRLQTMGSEPTGLCLSRVTRAREGNRWRVLLSNEGSSWLATGQSND